MKYDRIELVYYEWFRIARFGTLLVAVKGKIGSLCSFKVEGSETRKFFHPGFDEGIITVNKKDYKYKTPADFGIKSIKTVPVCLS